MQPRKGNSQVRSDAEKTLTLPLVSLGFPRLRATLLHYIDKLFNSKKIDEMREVNKNEKGLSYHQWLHFLTVRGYERKIFVKTELHDYIEAMFEANYSTDEALDVIENMQQ